jgi:NDP-sugar pyrophosphorylase family protein
MSMQAVILAGGLGTRLGGLTAGLPKPMVDVAGKLFLEYELALLRRYGISDIVLCIGHKADVIEGYFGDGSRFDMSIRYSIEGDELMGTAGAVKQAEHLIQDDFLLTYADTYLQMDYHAAYETFASSGRLGMMVVLPNDNGVETSNIIVEGDRVAVYDKFSLRPEMHHINFGVSYLRKAALNLVPAGQKYTQEDWYQDLIKDNNLGAFETHQRYYEIGSPDGLQEFRSLISRGVLV